jgi:1,4-alpha-glucan branching enzyme
LDGDTEWGAMINYNEPRVIDFFQQNVVYLLGEYRMDGIRFDFTRVVTRGGG